METVFDGNEADAESLNRDVAAMVREISKIGPRVPEVARILGRHKETVRYWYKKLEEHNFAIQAMANHEALGLTRVIMKVKFGQFYTDYVNPLMLVMNELCYVTSYMKALFEDVYIVQASVPSERVSEFQALTEDLRQLGVFSEIHTYLFDWFRNIPMRAENYDFAHGRWNFDPESLMLAANTQGTHVEDEPIAPKQKLDKIDLLITKEMLGDARREIQDIQQAIKQKNNVDINYKTLCWHLKEHVEGHGMLKGYRVNWMGTHYDQKVKRGSHRQHTYTFGELLVRGPTPEEKQRLRDAMARLPVVWIEASGRDYYTQMALPNEMFVETLQYIQQVMTPIRHKSEFYVMDQRFAAGFTFSYKLFNEETKAWDFDREELMAKFRALELQIKNL